MSTSTALAVEYQPTPDDYLAAWTEMAEGGRSFVDSMLYLRVWLLAGALASAVVSLAVTRALNVTTAAVAVAVSLVFVVLFTWQWSARGQFETQVKSQYWRGRNVWLYSKRALRIDPEWLCETTDVSELRIKWSAMEKAETTKGYLFLYTSNAGAVIVPRSAFASTDEFNQFVAASAEFLRVAGAGMSAGFPVIQDRQDIRPQLPSA
jgi:hypothetical protein